MKKEGRVMFFEQCLGLFMFEESFKAYRLVKEEMCKEKGFKRHNGTHYYYHLIDVSQNLINSGVRDQDIITAALLHDLVEDVLLEDGTPKYTIEDLETMFNKRVAKMVDLVTKERDIDYKANTRALVGYLNEISENAGASLIKVADRLNNLFDLLDSDFGKRKKIAIETQRYFIPFFKKCREKHPFYAAFFFEAKTTTEQQVQLIIQYHKKIEELEKEIK